MRRPLKGLLVADFSRILAGPLSTMLMSDAGARVIKIEEPVRGDETRRWGPPFVNGVSAYFLSVNRGKESITLDLKTAGGRDVARRIIERADVVIHNFRTTQEKAFGLTAAAVRRINRRAVHCMIRGYDRDSPGADLPGYDLLAQAAGGLMSITGERDGQPMKVGVALADVLTAHFAHGAILGALYEREKTGRGRSVEISLIGAIAASLVNVAQSHLVTGKRPGRYGNEHPSIVPYQAVRAGDRTMVIGVASDRHFELLSRVVLEKPELSLDPRFTTNALRVENRDALRPILDQLFSARDADVWVDRCRAVAIPAEVVRTVDELFAGEAAMFVQDVQHPVAGEIRLMGSPIRLDGALLPVTGVPPGVGQHTDRILRQLGYPRSEVRKLRDEGAL